MHSLPPDVLFHVLALLPLDAVLAVRRTSRALCAATRAPALWAVLFRTHVLARRIPAPADGPDFEAITRRALALRRAWTSPAPVPRRRLAFSDAASARVIFLQFLPGRARYLVSVRVTTTRTYLLQCWDLASDPRCVAELTHADGPYGGVVLNSDPSSPSVLAMQSALTETFSIDFDAQDPESAFVTEATIDGVRQLHLLAGHSLVTRDRDGALCLWDLAGPNPSQRVQLLNPSMSEPDDRVLAVHLARDYALVVRVQSLEIYSTTPRQNLVPVRGPPIAYPLAQHRLPWGVDAVVLAEEHSSSVIHLFIRFGSLHPWPVNVLHHYLLRPNPAMNHSVGTSEYNLPYELPPSLIHTIGSPVRMFVPLAMAVGQYGTALWLDNHSAEWLGPNERGQRLAGHVLGSHGRTEMTGASMVFGECETDEWTRVAMDEEAGRIAVGHVDGAITLLEY